MKRQRAIAATLTALALLVTACGDDGDAGDPVIDDVEESVDEPPVPAEDASGEPTAEVTEEASGETTVDEASDEEDRISPVDPWFVDVDSGPVTVGSTPVESSVVLEDPASASVARPPLGEEELHAATQTRLLSHAQTRDAFDFILVMGMCGPVRS